MYNNNLQTFDQRKEQQSDRISLVYFLQEIQQRMILNYENIFIHLLLNMEMDLEALMAEFMDLQQTKSNPLSERTLIELLLKLPSFGLVFYQTTDGNQYITQEALDAIIAETIKERGRVLTGELPQIIGTNLDVIEGRLNTVCNKHNLTKVDDKLMSPGYINELISNLREYIQSNGKMTMQEIIHKAQLPGTFVRKLVEQRINQLNSDLIKDVFVTKQYRLKLKSQLIGILNGVLKPSGLSALMKKFNISDKSVTSIIEQLISNEEVKGKVIHDYFVPVRFQQNQKNLIQSWLQTNNYIQYSQLQKNFFINKPKEWIKSNFGSKVILLDDSAFNVSAIENSRTNIMSLVKQQGFAQLSKVLPVFTDNDIQMLFNEHLKLPNLILSGGYCFDPEWLDKCCNAFRQKIIYNLFFKTEDPKNKKKKKTRITIEEMKQLLLQNDLLEYNVLEDIHEILYQQLSPRIDELYKQCSTELAQAKGIVTTNMLKYNKGKTILPSKERCIKYITTQEKQCKKSGKPWKDLQFGQTAEDPSGILSILYFDKIPPKEWVVQNISWNNLDYHSQKGGNVVGDIISSKFMQKCKVGEVIRLLDQYNKIHPKIIGFPFLVSEYEPFKQFGIHTFVFYIQNQQKYVMVDQFLPSIDGKLLSTVSSVEWVSLVEKSYAKLRYCYKGILNLGFSTVMQQLTGLSQLKKSSLSNLKQGISSFFDSAIQVKSKGLIVGVTEGELNNDIDFDGEPSGFKANRSYLITDCKNVSLNGKSNILFKVNVNNKCHQAFIPKPEDIIEEKWLQTVFKQECVLNQIQMQAVFKTLYIFGKE